MKSHSDLFQAAQQVLSLFELLNADDDLVSCSFGDFLKEQRLNYSEKSVFRENVIKWKVQAVNSAIHLRVTGRAEGLKVIRHFQIEFEECHHTKASRITPDKLILTIHEANSNITPFSPSV